MSDDQKAYLSELIKVINGVVSVLVTGGIIWVAASMVEYGRIQERMMTQLGTVAATVQDMQQEQRQIKSIQDRSGATIDDMATFMRRYRDSHYQDGTKP